MSRAVIICLLAILILPLSAVFAQEQEQEVNIYLFYSESCPYCTQEAKFLEKLLQKYDEVKVLGYEVSKNPQNVALLREIAETFKVNITGVPFTVIGDVYLDGWTNEETTGPVLERMIQYALGEWSGKVEELKPAYGKTSPISALPDTIKLPFFGEIELKSLSLPVLSIIIGGLDGFNPCAMWVLLFLIGLLLGMKDKKRMWILGSAFIIASAAVYYILMAAWLNLLLFLGLVIWIRILIGLVAVGSGGYYLKTYFTTPPGTCEVAGGERQQKIFDKLKRFVQEKHFWLALGGVVLLAFAVNIVEALCSAGLPVVYTKILTLAGLPIWQYYAYLLLYIFVFMLDDLIIFFAAMWTLQTVAFTGKYSHLSRLIGGIVMIAIGLLLLFRPEWLMF